MDIPTLRSRYEAARFDKPDVDPDPFVQFHRWYDEVLDAGYFEPYAMVLATVDDRGWPSARNVLLRGLGPEGFDFFTNYTSDKARDLEGNGRAAVVFSWNMVHRQIRIVGTVSRAPAAVSDAYFASRPRGAQVSAWASDQSEVVSERATLVRQHNEIEERYAGTTIPRPDFWGGYRLVAQEYEFWQGRDDRLHDRLRYTFTDGHWIIDRLAP